MALGAVSEGCATGLTPFLPDMVAMLLPTLGDPRPLVRCIRYAHPCWGHCDCSWGARGVQPGMK